jgi:hypothetical protein
VPRTVTVTRDHRIAATPDAVWEVVADPAAVPRLDERCRVESTYGSWGSVPSGYVILVRGSRLRYLVTEATPGLRWVAVVERNGRQHGVQRAELVGADGGTLLRWTVEVAPGPLPRRLVERLVARELEQWLDAVEREALASPA